MSLRGQTGPVRAAAEPGSVPRPLVIAGAALLATGCAVAELVRPGTGVAEAAEAAVAGLVAALALLVALTLRGATWRGAVFGGVFVTAGILSWTLMTDPLPIWLALGAGGVVFLVWSWPWWKHLARLPRLGGFWLGVAYWLLGVVGAVLAADLSVTAQRVAYAGVFGLAVLAAVAVLRRVRSDLTVGAAAAFLVAIAVLLVVGSGNVFDRLNPVPAGPWGSNMAERFWGSDVLLYHPNSLALIGVIVAVRVGADAAFAAWQRVSTLALCGLLIYLTESRTAFGVLLAAAALHAGAVFLRVVRYPDGRARWTAVALPFVALALVLAVSGGQGFLYKSRYGGADITSGRTETWAQVGREWKAAGIGDKLFGDTKTSRAVVKRGGNSLPTDNALVGSLRRGGVLGVAAFLLGLYLLVRRATPGLLPDRWAALVERLPGGGGARRAPPWLPMLVLAMVPAIAVTDWLLGGTGGTLWIILVLAEAALIVRPPEAGNAAGSPV
jgi:hypothetical protein